MRERWLWRGLLLVCAFFFVRYLRLEGDTAALVRENDAMLACLREGRAGACPEGGSFALLQRIPALLLRGLGFEGSGVVRGLSVVSLASFAAMVAWSWRSLRRAGGVPVAMLFAGVLVFGPLPWYARASFGEMLAAFCTLAFVIRAFESPRSPGTAVAFVAAGLSKEIAPPLLVLLYFAAGGFRARGRELGRRFGFAAACAGLALVLNAGLNQFRFGTVTNATYLNPMNFVRGWDDQWRYWLGMWVSPNAGLAFFWPVSVGLLAAAGFVPAARRALAWGLVVLAILSFGLSRWYAPYGWVAWGPRLLLPWVPAVAYLVLRDAAPAWRERLLRFRRWPVAVAAAAVLSFPQLALVYDPGIQDRFFAPDEGCPREAVIDHEPDFYYHCIHHATWRRRWALAPAFDPTRRPGAKVLAVLATGVLAWPALRRKGWRARAAG
jgi:hypothetical protein